MPGADYKQGCEDHVGHAEDDHPQYLARNPTGYCGISGTGVSCPAGLV